MNHLSINKPQSDPDQPSILTKEGWLAPAHSCNCVDLAQLRILKERKLTFQFQHWDMS